jgi:acetolactate synthase-1/3 small subunit
LILIKVNAESSRRGEIIQIVEIFRGRIVDVGETACIVEVTGDEGKINAIENALRPFGIIELVRTGKVAMQRGSQTVLVED